MNAVKQYKEEMTSAIEVLLNALKQSPEIWSLRKEVAHLLFDNARYDEAAELVWSAPEIPAIDLEIAFTARVLSRAQPKRAIRLLKYVISQTRNNPAKLLAIANALMHYGMVMQASRFYGAATALDGNFSNGELEHFMLWLDDSHRLWGDWAKEDQPMDELPWVKREDLKSADDQKMMSGLTTPIKVPGLNELTSEHMLNEYYRQSMMKDGEITAPPAVTVPLDRLNPDDVIRDNELGAPLTPQKADSKVVDFSQGVSKSMTAEAMEPKAPALDLELFKIQPKRSPELVLPEGSVLSARECESVAPSGPALLVEEVSNKPKLLF